MAREHRPPRGEAGVPGEPRDADGTGGAGPPSGGAILWKPIGPTTREALEEAERRLGVRPLGHTGTLDPLACGVVVVLGGEARKFQEVLTRHDKEYVARIALGLRSGSLDAEGPLACVVPRPTLPGAARLAEVLATFLGPQVQVPPALSAVRIAGRRAHDLARSGATVELAARTVEIHAIELVDYLPPVATVRLRCGAGTYVRSLARDLGDRLGTGAFLAGLRRVRVGIFAEPDAIPLGQLSTAAWRSTEYLLAANPRIELDDGVAQRLRHGQRVPHAEAGPAQVCVAWHAGRVVGLVEVGDGLLRSRRWLAG